jgi:hypothetical protein
MGCELAAPQQLAILEKFYDAQQPFQAVTSTIALQLDTHNNRSMQLTTPAHQQQQSTVDGTSLHAVPLVDSSICLEGDMAVNRRKSVTVADLQEPLGL